MRVWISILLAVAGFTFSIRAAEEPFFPIMGWNSAPNNPAALKQMKDCGLTVAGFVDVETLDACHQAGLKAIVMDARASSYDWASPDIPSLESNLTSLVQEVQSHPAVLGFYLRDEPGAPLFPGLAAATKKVRELAPQAWAYINLFPNYATPQQLGAATYEEYLSRFIETVNPVILSYDHYSFFEGNVFRADGYFLNLEQMRSASLRSKKPFWNIVQSVGALNFREVGSTELRLQVYTSLAYGAKGITYFQYRASPVGNFRGSPLDQFGNVTPLWHAMQNVNWQVQKLAPVLLKLRSESVYHFGSVPPGCSGPNENSFVKAAPGTFVVGDFRHENGNRYVMVVNSSLTGSLAAQPEFHVPVKKILLVSAYTGEETEFEGEQRWLAPGQGALLRLEE